MSKRKKQRRPGMVMMETERGKICRKTAKVFHSTVPEKLGKHTCLGKEGRKEGRKKQTNKQE
jgi:hypothetical protein